GSDAYNMRLSKQRAEAVRNFLISRGVAADRLTAKGYGEAQPVADNATEEGRFKNRRVELVPLK
ncbi:MAG: OmpA family protein, partial [Thiobacillus sp.]|nr:OmpA family protein [Thiobacillus sp.]